MILITLLVFAAVISFLAFFNSFPLLKFGAGISWIALFIYCVNGLTPTIEQGSGTHIAILLVIIFMAVTMILSGLGRTIQSQRQIRGGIGGDKIFSASEFKWRFGKDKREYNGEYSTAHRETAEEYRAKVHSALRRK